MNNLFYILQATETVQPTTLNEVFSFILQLLGAGAPLGLWVKWQIDKNRQKLEQKETADNILSKIAESDERQTAQISEIQGEISILKSDISEQKEITKAESDLRKLKIRINETFDTILSANEVKNTELIMTLQNAKDKALQVFSAVLIDAFDTEETTLKNQLIIKAKDVKRTINFDKLDFYDAEIESDLTEKLKHRITQFIVAYSFLRKKENGVRRKAFIEETNTLIAECMTLSINTLSK